MDGVNDAFRNTRRFTFAVLLAIFSLCIASIVVMGKDAAAIVVVGIPSLAGLTSVYTGITNKWGKQDERE